MLDRAADAFVARREADRELIVAAVEWAELHPAPAGAPFAGWGEPDLHGEGVVPLAGVGAPLVAEFAPCELAAVLGWTTDAARELIGDGLELAHRLPRLWRLVLDLVVPVHLARHIAGHTRDLGPEAVAYADRLVTADPAHIDRVRAAALVHESRLWFDPDREIDDELTALATRKVELHPHTTTQGADPLTTDVVMVLDTADAEAFDAAVTRGAEALKRLGDGDPLDVRRAHTVGILADPQRALDLFAVHDPGPAAMPSSVVLHLNAEDLDRVSTDPAVVTVVGPHQRGPVLLDVLHAWLPGTTVVVRPVLDLSRTDAVDAHDPPPWMADLVRFRDPTCVFPGCRRRSQACDLDHIEPYQPPQRGGPPGQTRPANLAPLCRRHHRAKTHGGWAYRRHHDGTYTWTSPIGRTHTVPPPPPRPPRPVRRAIGLDAGDVWQATRHRAGAR